MTICANCRTTQGPFIKDLGFGDIGAKVCGYPPRYKADAKKVEKRVSECNIRRGKLDDSGT